MGKLEAPIQKSILDYLKVMRIPAWKHPSVGYWSAKDDCFIPGQSLGVSDIEGLIPAGHKFNRHQVAIPLYIEVKTPKFKPTMIVKEKGVKMQWSEGSQARFIKMVKAAGGIAFVAKSSWDVEKELEGNNEK